MSEDFTTFTAGPENTAITVDSASKVSWVQFEARADSGWLYKDYGVNHFSGDFTHQFEFYIDSNQSLTYCAHWMLSNTIGDMKDVIDASADAMSFAVYGQGADNPQIRLVLWENGGERYDNWDAVAVDTLYFVTITRVDNGGANGTGQLTAVIRTGSHTGTIQDTLVIDCAAGEQNDFRYYYPIAGYDSNNTGRAIWGYVQNMELNEGVTNIPEFMRHYRNLRAA